ncbi:unnamed protein product [Urochloa decumbens]|uniref:DUF4220 domain-containing protein n=1 Tax=Urochloa decumbens TaxID=240449 RepID=A0ABC9D8B0_9POAL
MAFATVLQWWEEWQLRILVLSSLCIQCYLSFFALARKKRIRPIFRFSIWLAYLGGDAVAIYALATLFNRRSKERWYDSATGSQNLEVLWAPILLMHLRGQITISAYNIEDNELWRRHIVTAVSQVCVAFYVFYKSWSPWSPLANRKLLPAAVVLLIVGFFKCFEKPLALKRNSFSNIVSSFYPTPRTKTTNREVELEEYIQNTRDFIKRRVNHSTLDKHEKLPDIEKIPSLDKLFVDFTYAYHVRLAKLKRFWLISGEEAYYEKIRTGISNTFDIFYMKFFHCGDDNRLEGVNFGTMFGTMTSFLIGIYTLVLPIYPIAIFHRCHKDDYSGSDIKVLYITYLLEISSFLSMVYYSGEWTDEVAQHSLIGYLAHSRRHTWLIEIAKLLQCFKPSCYSSKDITALVRDNVRDGWSKYITDVESYWKFNDMRGHLTLERNGCEEEILRRSLEKPFDESIILWHVATDLCFFQKLKHSDGKSATQMQQCREISNYMMHLLFANPEMPMPGSRRKLLTEAYSELEHLDQRDHLPLFDTGEILDKLNPRGSFIYDASALAQALMQLGDEEKMWQVMRGVWIEMLCFSAGRCRGYLHARSLGSGGEYLTFVSLLMSHAGLETFSERQQRMQLRMPKELRLHIVRIRSMRREIEEASRKVNQRWQEALGASAEIEVVVIS